MPTPSSIPALSPRLLERVAVEPAGAPEPERAPRSWLATPDDVHARLAVFDSLARHRAIRSLVAFVSMGAPTWAGALAEDAHLW